MKLIKVKLDNRDQDGNLLKTRKIVECEYLRDTQTGTNILVRLADGNIIKRNKVRDLVYTNAN